MGREANCVCRWNGQTGAVKALLEADELILRGELKAKFPRSSLGEVEAKGDELHFRAGKDRVALLLGADAAARWVKAIATAPPDLAGKLGIGPSTRVRLLGANGDPELAAAMEKGNPAGTDVMVIACVTAPSELGDAVRAHADLRDPAIPIWVVYRKGAKSPCGETAVREAMRDHGFIDTKVASVSAQSTAARFIVRR